MGLRQHPGPLVILGLVSLVTVVTGCTFPAPPATSFLGSKDPTPAESSTPWSTTLKDSSQPAGPPAIPPSAATAAPGPVSTPAPSPLAMAVQRATSHYERGIQAIRNGNGEQAEWEFDAALETLLDMDLDGQAPTGLLRATPLSQFPARSWLSSLANPPRRFLQEPMEPSGTEEPPLEAPALLGPEDLQAVTSGPAEEAVPVPEPEAQKYDIPIVFNDQVKSFIQYFQTRKWGLITRAFERASRYLPMMREIFRESGLPEDLLNLAFIESAVNPRATSRAKAAGIWQFIPSTGRLFGMRTSWWLDERRDPEKSTRAAATYLKNLYQMFESWPLALAAYNAGEGKLQRAIQRQNTRDFWSLRLPRETKFFVPAFMAMTVIAREPERYGFSPPPEEPLETDSVILHHPTDLRAIAQAAGVPVERIRELNPELIRWTTPPDVPRYAVRIPAGLRDEFQGALSRIPPEQRLPWIRHRVRKGETLAIIARRYKVETQIIRDMNGLSKRHALRPGATLLVPLAPGARLAAIADGPGQPTSPVARPAASQRYTVKKGDTLWDIARAHAVSLEDLRRWNNVRRDGRIYPGQTLVVRGGTGARLNPVAGTQATPEGGASKASPAMTRYRVKRGDTLWDIARAHAVSLDDLRRWNNLPRDASLRPGQELRILQSPS